MTNDTPSPESTPVLHDERVIVDRLCERLRAAVRAGQPAPFEALLAEAPARLRDALLAELIAEDAQLRAERGEEPRREDYADRFSDRRQAAGWGFSMFDPGATSPPDVETSERAGSYTSGNNAPAGHLKEGSGAAAPEPLPSKIGEYEVHRKLGEGGFGRVFLASGPAGDAVALKVLRAKWLGDAKYREMFLQEARWMAETDHPHLVKVLEIGEAHEPPFFVQQYVAAGDLSDYARREAISPDRAAEIVAQIADALAEIHRRGLYHRDLKPANVLMDEHGKAYVADFGLALSVSELWLNIGHAPGTLRFMSREQLQGETPLLTARSDLWSLGVIFYWLLTRQYPFNIGTPNASPSTQRRELVNEILRRTPRAPREIDPSIPPKYQRLCMHCLMKEIHLRPQSAADFRDALLQAIQTHGAGSTPRRPQPADPVEPTDFPRPTLRRFTADQAQLYLRLMPPSFANPQELPEGIAYWKQRIEAQADDSFRVGVLVGVSGAGKSSLLEAGLLPQLAPHVRRILVQASEGDTEAQVLKQLARQIPAAGDRASEWSLTDWIVNLRDGPLLGEGEKLLMVLDQFEQWLHAHGGETGSQLETALRQCDGRRVQAIVCVREGFHSSLMRFVESLDLGLDLDANYATAHRFSPSHARYVLEQFGRGVGRLEGDLRDEQKAFLDAAVMGLAEEDRAVVCVRLVVLALVMQDRLWTVEELQKLGGLDGIGREFLLQSFNGRTAPEQLRRLLPAAIRVLDALLPDEGIEIKDFRSHSELLEASKLPEPRFNELLNILVRRLFLVTPVDVDAGSVDADHADDDGERAPSKADRGYQLTHDFLVPSVRQWIAQMEEESPDGRTRLILRRLARAWRTEQESANRNRHLPSLPEYLQIRRRTDRADWTKTQAALMRAAGWFYAKWTGVVLLALVALASLTYAGYYEANANTLTKQLLDAKADRIGEIRKLLPAFRWRVDPILTPFAAQDAEPLQAIHAQVGLVGRHADYAEPLIKALTDEGLRLPWEYIAVIGDALSDADVALPDSLAEIMRDASRPAEVRFRAGLVLSRYRPHSEEIEGSIWVERDAEFLVAQFLATNPEFHGVIRRYLTPNATFLKSSLAKAFLDSRLNTVQQEAVARAVVEFFLRNAEPEYDRLLPLLLQSTPEQFEILFPLIENCDAAITRQLQALVDELPAKELSELDRLQLGRRRAVAAITLMRQGERAAILNVLRVVDDPESLTQFVHRCRDRGVTAAQLLVCLDHAAARRDSLIGKQRELEERAIYGLLLALGEFSELEIAEAQRQPLLERLAKWYADDPSSGIHGACGWLLRKWGQEAVVRRMDEAPIPYKEDREWFTLQIPVDADAAKDGTARSLYLTFLVFRAGTYLIGSPLRGERETGEILHEVELTYDFAILDREITATEFLAFMPKHGELIAQSLDSQYSVVSTTWYESAKFCRWLTEKRGLGDQQAYDDPEELLRNGAERDADLESVGHDAAPLTWPVHLDRAGFRLPTEAEWEIASRSGMSDSGAYGFGREEAYLDRYGWFAANSGGLHTPGWRRPSLRGLFDMHGNANEWCHDLWGGYHETTFRDPVGPDKGVSRVTRGGSFGWTAWLCRSATRRVDRPAYRRANLGFRIAFSLLPGQAGKSGIRSQQ